MKNHWSAYLTLSRLSNLPTVWSNVLAGLALAGPPIDLAVLTWVAVAMSLAYTGGMFLNDAFDAPSDAVRQPSRPIPSGAVTRIEVFVVGALLLGSGTLMVIPRPHAMLPALGLAAAIVLYDARHKQVAVAPVVMGLCRGLVYLVAAGSVAPVAGRVVGAAAIVLVYVSSLTFVARRLGPSARWAVPLLIAGISLVDALVILGASDRALVALVAALGFPLTLLSQRLVSGD